MRVDAAANGAGDEALVANGLLLKAVSAAEAKLDEGDIQEAESSLREGLSLNYEEARALLGRLEYQRGNVEAALRVFEGIDLQAAIQRFQPSLSAKASSARGRSHSDSSTHSVSQHAASLILEAIYLKAMSLQKLNKAVEAAQECRSVLDAVERMFLHGVPDILVEQKLQGIVSKAVELLPELWKLAGSYQEALASYRRALLGQWNLDDECTTRIQKRFAVFLLYSGVEVGPPSLASQPEGAFIPKNNFEEAILLLMILLRKWLLGKARWDPLVMEHLTFALSLCGQTSILARLMEEVFPGIYPHSERCLNLALCCSSAGEDEAALNLLRTGFNKHEFSNNSLALLLAAKMCSENSNLASEGARFAERALSTADTADPHLRGVALRVLGCNLSKKSKLANSDHDRTHLQAEALRSLSEALALDRSNPELIFEMGLEYAEQGNMTAALRCAKDFIHATGGSVSKGWRFLALVLSAQQRYPEAEAVIEAALVETPKWQQGPLLRMKAKLKVVQSLPMEAIESYRYLLALAQAQRKSVESANTNIQVGGNMINEYEVWLGLAGLYSGLSYWKDAETCLQKARSLNPFSAPTMHAEGTMHEAQGHVQEALGFYTEALSLDLDHVPSKVSLGMFLSKRGPTYLPTARSFLLDALRLEPTNRAAWYHLGLVHKSEGRVFDAAECLQAAAMLEESEPLESFSSLSCSESSCSLCPLPTL